MMTTKTVDRIRLTLERALEDVETKLRSCRKEQRQALVLEQTDAAAALAEFIGLYGIRPARVAA